MSRIDDKLNEWLSQEKNFSNKYGPEIIKDKAFLKVKLNEFRRILKHSKSLESLDRIEKNDKKVLKSQIATLEKKLYPNVLVRWARAIHRKIPDLTKSMNHWAGKAVDLIKPLVPLDNKSQRNSLPDVSKELVTIVEKIRTFLQEEATKKERDRSITVKGTNQQQSTPTRIITLQRKRHHKLNHITKPVGKAI